MFEPVRFCYLCYFELQGWRSKKYFQNFVQIVRLLESNNFNATTNDLKPRTTYQWTWNSMVTNGMVLQKLQRSVTWFAGILTDFYYKRLIEISIKLKPGFLKLFLCGCLYVCICVCLCVHLRLLITSGVMWRDVDRIWLVRFYSYYMATVVGIVNGCGLCIGMRCRC